MSSYALFVLDTVRADYDSLKLAQFAADEVTNYIENLWSKADDPITTDVETMLLALLKNLTHSIYNFGESLDLLRGQVLECEKCKERLPEGAL